MSNKETPQKGEQLDDNKEKSQKPEQGSEKPVEGFKNKVKEEKKNFDKEGLNDKEKKEATKQEKENIGEINDEADKATEDAKEQASQVEEKEDVEQGVEQNNNEEKKELISNTSNLEELFDVINQIGTFKTSSGEEVTPSDFKQLIKTLKENIDQFDGEVGPKFPYFRLITRKFGLRDKVIEFFVSDEKLESDGFDSKEMEKGDKERLEESRKSLVEVENKLRKYKGITGSLKGLVQKEAKTEVEKKYHDALEHYQNLKDNYLYNVIPEMDITLEEKNLLKATFITEEKTKMVEARIAYNQETSNLGSELKRFYNQLGKENVAKLLGKEFMSKFEKKEGDNRFVRFLKGGARFLSNALSLRLGISMGLIGLGALSGGTVVAAGAYGLKRVLVGLGTGFASYDLMSKFAENKELSKVKEGVTKEKMSELSDEEIIDKMAYFERKAENNKDQKEGYEVLDNETYKILSNELENRIKENRISKELRNLIKNTDKVLKDEREKHEKADIKRKIIAGGIGVFFGSGAIGKITSKLWPGGDDAIATEDLNPEDTPSVEGPEDTPSAEGLRPEVQENVQPEEVGYQGGSSIWKESENQLDTRLGGAFNKDLDVAQKTYLIDHFKDRFFENPQEFGLDPDVDIDQLTKDQMEKIEWDKLFDLTDQENLDDFNSALKNTLNLTEDAKENIINSNNILDEYFKKTGESIDTENVDNLLSDIKEAGNVDQYMVEQITSDPLPAGELNLQNNIDDIKSINSALEQGQNVFENDNTMEAIKNIAQNNGFEEKEVNLFEHWSKYQVENDIDLQNIIGERGNLNAKGFKSLIEGFETKMGDLANGLSNEIKEPNFLRNIFSSFKKPFLEWGSNFGIDKTESTEFYQYLIGEQGGKQEVFESLKAESKTIYDWFLKFKLEQQKIL